ncbi:hypothetical protein BKH42_01000 [Helicobacter sp. 13S00482-2]|uniref:hypothetical protein n=1 Tax=Helicobacter sp. 13S00482-2 TaxID=1476200 RepID=UPI000BA63ADF|nr:hypothetical protein [Helicobacter sp. 13S00482-2]PAF54517.1 hypothetical protein BKH42_01000 [Helicobacter sp. 13S00482-2]
MEFLRSVFVVFFIGAFALLAKEISLPVIVIPPQKIQNFFHPNLPQKMMLEMILNQKAKINGKWYKKGEYFSKYQIFKIENDKVILKKSNNTLTLHISTQKQNVIKTKSHSQPKISFNVNKNPTD